jgi:putative addiction module killer protein
MNYTIKQTETFEKWHLALRDLRAKAAIFRRIDRAAHGNFGDFKPVGEGVSELRIDVGPGYRVYFTIKKGELLVLLVGGDKSTQQADIQRAIKLSKEVDIDD